MSFYSSFFDVFFDFLIFLFTLISIFFFRKYFFCSFYRAFFLFSWHSVFCLIYLYYVSENGGDAIVYYLSSLSYEIEFSVGTKFILFITSLLSQGLGVTIIGCFLVFNFFGVIGLLAFDASLRTLVVEKTKTTRGLALLVVLLPSVSFWSAGLGKDAISFMSIGLALWASVDIRRRYVLMAFAILFIFFVRPHIAAILISALGASILFNSRVSSILKIILACVIAISGYFLLPYSLNYAGLKEGVGVSEISGYISKRQGYNMEGGGGIDISSMSYPMQLFTYMFRPLPFEAHSFSSLMASLDNLVLLYVSFLGFLGFLGFLFFRRSFLVVKSNVFLPCVYSFLAWSVLAVTTANLGVSVRQKWMVAPFLIYILFMYIGNKKRYLRKI